MRKRALFFLILLLVSSFGVLPARIPVALGADISSGFNYRKQINISAPANQAVSAGSPIRIVVSYDGEGLNETIPRRYAPEIIDTGDSSRGGVTDVSVPIIMRDPVSMEPILYNDTSDTVGEGVYWGAVMTRAGNAFTGQFDLYNSTDLFTWVEYARNIVTEDGGAWDKDFYTMSSFTYHDGEATPFFIMYCAWTTAGLVTSEKQVGGAQSTNMSVWVKSANNPLYNHTEAGWSPEGAEVFSFVATPAGSAHPWLAIYEGERGGVDRQGIGIAYSDGALPWTKDWTFANRTFDTCPAGYVREVDPYVMRIGNQAYIFYELYPTGSTDRPAGIFRSGFDKVFNNESDGWTRLTPRPWFLAEDFSGNLYGLNVSNSIYITVGSTDVVGSTYYIIEDFVNIDSNAQADFDDIRFVDSDETTLLSHELVRKVDGEHALFEVASPAIAKGASTTIYIYYDKATATDASVAVTDYFENFTAYTEVDPGSDWVHVNDSVTTTWLSDRDEKDYLYFDRGAGAIDEFDMYYATRINHKDDKGVALIGVGSTLGSYAEQATASGDGLFLELYDMAGVAPHRFHGWYLDGGALTAHASPYDSVDDDAIYYVSLHKDGAVAWFEIYEDWDRTSLLDNQSFALTSDETFRYVYAWTGRDNGNIENIDANLQYLQMQTSPLYDGIGAPEAVVGNTAPARGNYVVNFYDGGTLFSDGEPSARFWFTATDADGWDTIASMEYAVQIGATWCNFSYDSTSAIGDGVWSKTTDQSYIEMYDDGFSGAGSDFTMFSWIQVNPACPDQYGLTVYQRITDDSSATSGWGVILGNPLSIVEPGDDAGTGGSYTPPDDDGPPPDDDEPDPCWWTDPDHLNDMSEGDLRILADSLGIIYTEDATKADLILLILEKAEEVGCDPFSGCGMDEEAKLAKLNYLLGLSIEELRLECQSLGINYKLWRDPEPYIILIFTVGYQCSPPDAFYDSGYFDPEDWDGDGVPNWDDPDMFDEGRMGLGARVDDIDLSASTPWIQNNGWVVIILLLFLAFMYSQVQKKDKPGSRGESLLRTRSGEYTPGARRK